MKEVLLYSISPILSLIGVIITCVFTSKNTRDNVAHKLEISRAVTDTKIDELTREVRNHNNFAQRMPVLEERVGTMCTDMERLKDYHRE